MSEEHSKHSVSTSPSLDATLPERWWADAETLFESSLILWMHLCYQSHLPTGSCGGLDTFPAMIFSVSSTRGDSPQ